MEARREEYTKELDRLLWPSDVPAPRPDNEYYAVRNKEGRLLAAGVCWTSRMHPERIRFFVSVEELYRRRGLGTAIFEKMRADHEGAKWQGSADLDNEDAEWWLRSRGFRFLCRRYWLDAMAVDLEQSGRCSLPILRCSQLSRAQRDQLTAMVWTDYAAKYEKIDPLNGKIGAEDFREYMLGGLDEDITCCLMDGDRIEAYVCCAAGADDWTRSVICTGHRLQDKALYRNFLAEFANRAFERTGGLIMEADSFDEDALMLLRLFGELPEDSYDTYVMG